MFPFILPLINPSVPRSWQSHRLTFLSQFPIKIRHAHVCTKRLEMPSLQVQLCRTVPHFELRREWMCSLPLPEVWLTVPLLNLIAFFTCSISPFLRLSRVPPWAHTGARAKGTSSTTGAAATWAPSVATACPTAAPCFSLCKSLSSLTSSKCLGSSSPPHTLIAAWQYLVLLRKVPECSALSVLCVIMSHGAWRWVIFSDPFVFKMRCLA